MEEKKEKIRLDQLLVQRNLAASREQAQKLIMAGKVLVNDRIMDKAGIKIDTEAQLTMREKGLAHVSRGGEKLEGALEEFKIDVTDLVVSDVGASTGGFTDCLLQRGAKRVFAIDVGYGQLAWKLRQDPRVVCLEKKNIRFIKLEDLGQRVDLATIDVSFISLELVIPPVVALLEEKGQILALIKPQFEVGKGQVGKGGVIKDPEKHQAVISKIRDFSEKMGLTVIGVCESKLLGPKGNKEFFIYLIKEH
ncbi:MAG: TlyA family RNA methyltransferase [Candidatus Tectomicrobia bacterium]|uniref:TlyA family RNA methyltransferase n=1 Tax=Tectimicrobiota bacterium TaxID=2528274 RepID=A0A933GKG9_UNCTE|nr:TlyA family RNA methyltransferase [Candidatus Tectomicrobia bacterium]